LPRLFERFHRAKGTRARTHEGSGIGLAFVLELVKLHGGSVEAASELGCGSTFTVRLPLGTAHLPADRLGAPRHAAPVTLAALPFVEEALTWDAGAVPLASLEPRTRARVRRAAEDGGSEGPFILVADDNADMRAYIARILGEAWTVHTVADGEQALRYALARRPDLVVADVMMPVLDGFGLVRGLRSDPTTADVPIVLLSARAGEEATAEGLAQGANDYLVKPFSSRELVARVAAQLEAARTQQVIKKASESERRRLYSFFMAAPAAIAILRGPQLVFELANEMHQRIVGKRDLLGKPGREALPELIGQGVWDLVDRIYETGVPFVAKEFPAQFARGTGGRLDQGYFDWVGQPLRDADGHVDAVMIFSVEVTDQVVARREVEEARQTESDLRRMAEEANRAKDEFLAILGHELRNPLSPMLTALHLMRLRGNDRTEKERTILERQVGHLTRLVDDLMDVSRITRGKIKLKKQRCELSEIVARGIEMASPLIEQRQHHLSVDVPRTGLAVQVDQVRLAQVVSNLLTNAAKYTDPGGQIAVSGRRDFGEVALVVRDTGVGITAEMLPRVFDLFAQERQSSDRTHGGLGLGLTIVRSLVALHGGSVVATSPGHNRGSEFTVRLPAAPAEGAPAEEYDSGAAAPVQKRSGHRVLVVDDNEDAATLIAEMLTELGYETRVAHDGPAALLAAAELIPDVAVLDIGLPVIDGYELARRLREQPALCGLRLVALTGYGQESDMARSREAGFTFHLVKPVDPTRLATIIEELTSGDLPGTHGATRPRTSGFN
jgi:signal transduction histidine kinase